MTEDEWHSCTDALAMLRFIRGSASPRKCRLFTAAAWRRCGHLLENSGYHHAVEVAERLADGLAGEEERAALFQSAHRLAWGEGWEFGPLWDAGWAMDPYLGAATCVDDPNAPSVLAVACAAEDAYQGAWLSVPWAVALGLTRAKVATLLRDIFHAPYRAVYCRSSWLQWSGGRVAGLARAAYEDRNFDVLPVIADALEDAGCSEAELLEHLRGPGPHTRGCWTIDLLLRKA